MHLLVPWTSSPVRRTLNEYVGSLLYYLPLPQLCVRLASGGDPTYSFNVRLTGEEVHGTRCQGVQFNAK
jgi:hypothetical protein